MKRILAPNIFNLCLIAYWFSSSVVFGNNPPPSSSTPSDQYCGYLQALEAKAYRENEGQNRISQFIEFMSEFIRKVSLENIEKEAIEKKMTFEAFQKWAKNEKSIEVSPYYKGKYLKRYRDVVCGEIEGSYVFGSTPEPEMTITAQKKFNPSGHPYFEEMPSGNETGPEAPQGDQ